MIAIKFNTILSKNLTGEYFRSLINAFKAGNFCTVLKFHLRFYI